jgi:tetrahydromethanopterin S-methyltransferase subunit G
MTDKKDKGGEAENKLDAIEEKIDAAEEKIDEHKDDEPEHNEEGQPAWITATLKELTEIRKELAELKAQNGTSPELVELQAHQTALMEKLEAIEARLEKSASETATQNTDGTQKQDEPFAQTDQSANHEATEDKESGNRRTWI